MKLNCKICDNSMNSKTPAGKTFICDQCGNIANLEPMIKIQGKDSLIEALGISIKTKRIRQSKLIHLLSIRAVEGHYTYKDKCAEYIIKDMINRNTSGDRYLPGLKVIESKDTGPIMTFTTKYATLAEEVTRALSQGNMKLIGYVGKDFIEIDAEVKA